MTCGTVAAVVAMDVPMDVEEHRRFEWMRLLLHRIRAGQRTKQMFWLNWSMLLPSTPAQMPMQTR
jgi:hypothetical protein